MLITSKLNMDLFHFGTIPTIYVVQDDRYSRTLELSIFANGIPSKLPEDYQVIIRYVKPDGKHGAYDTLPDGTQAWKIQENRITMHLAPEVTTCAGDVSLMATLVKNQSELTTFTVKVHVAARPQGIPASKNYLNITGFLPQPAEAKSGEFVKATWVDEFGRIAGVETEPISSLPTVNAEMEGAFLRVRNGSWAAVQIESAEGVGF